MASSPSKPGSVVKNRSIHSPASYNRPSSAETSSAGRGRRRVLSKTPQSPLRHSIRSHKEAAAKEDWVPVNLEAEPGGPDWNYYSQPVAENLAKGLAHKWPAIENTFVTMLKSVFQIMRGERECICVYFFSRR